jgi:hypothetical protein
MDDHKGCIYSREQAKLIQFRFRMNDNATAAGVYVAVRLRRFRSGTVYCLDEISGRVAGERHQFGFASLIAIDGSCSPFRNRRDALNPLSGIQMWYTTGIAKFWPPGRRICTCSIRRKAAVLDAKQAGVGSMPVAGIGRAKHVERSYLRQVVTGSLMSAGTPTSETPEHGGFAITEAERRRSGSAADDAAPTDAPGSPPEPAAARRPQPRPSRIPSAARAAYRVARSNYVATCF